MPLSRFQAMQHAGEQIVEEIKSYGPGHIFTFSALRDILKDNRERWILPKVTTTKDFIKFLAEEGILHPVEIETPWEGNAKRYILGEASPYRIALSLRKDSYLSHYTALYLHELTDNIPKNIFTNKEQSRKPSNADSNLRQENIDRAFSKPMRKTNQVAEFDGHRVYLINGKNVSKLGVIDNFSLDDEEVSITGMERTLIDAVVRPGYVGGVQEVFGAFKMAQGQISVNRLMALLKKMNYRYPYHQAVGFYLEKAGYKNSQLALVERMEANCDFYLTYNMDDKAYSKRWRLYYPERFG